MRAVFSVLGLVVVVAIVGLLAKRQLTAGVPAAAGEGVAPAAVAPQQQVQQVKQSVDALMQAPRPALDEGR